jgi:hypothetical protein
MSNTNTITTTTATLTVFPIKEIRHKGYDSGPRIWQTQRIEVEPRDGSAPYAEEHSFWREGDLARVVRVTTRRVA